MNIPKEDDGDVSDVSLSDGASLSITGYISTRV